MHLEQRVSGRRLGFATFSAALLGALGVVGLAVSSAAASPEATARPAAGYITDFVKYVKGKPGSANTSLSPVKIGWVNNQDGTITPYAPQATPAAEVAVKWINKFASGIGGHPLELDECFVKNAEEEGLTCGQRFLNDSSVNVISYGAVGVGANTINSTVAGKKPIIMGFSLSPLSDTKNPNSYILFTAGNFGVYAFGEFGRRFLHAKTAAILYPQEAGADVQAKAMKDAAVAAGIKTKVVGFNPNSSDLLGAFTSAGAQTADYIILDLTSPANCLASAKALNRLKVDPGKVAAITECASLPLAKKYPGGDIPKWNFGIAQSGDVLAKSPTGVAFTKALAAFGEEKNVQDPWYPGMFASILTIAQFMNAIGVDKLTPAAIAAKAKVFRGPLLLGGALVQCGKYPSAPAVCGDGNAYFRYQGNGKWKRIVRWLEPPVELQKKLHAKTVTP